MDGFFIIIRCLVTNESLAFLSATGPSLVAWFSYHRLTLIGVSLDTCYMHGSSYSISTEKGGSYLMCKVNEPSLEAASYTPHICKFGIKTYDDPLNTRALIREDNKGKVGIYCWFNKVNGKFYIGSGDPLYGRLRDYYQDWYYSTRANLYIIRALSKYSMFNFSLVILEYTTSDQLIACEQKWIDLLKPEYNLCPVAGSSKGYTHTDESLEKMRKATLGRTHTSEVRQLMRESRIGVNNSFYGKKHSEETIASFRLAARNRTKPAIPGIEVEITDIETNITTTYASIRKAADAINSDIKSLSRREKLQIKKGINTAYRNKYMIVFKRP